VVIELPDQLQQFRQAYIVAEFHYAKCVSSRDEGYSGN